MEIDRIIEDLEEQIALGKSIKEEVDVLFLTRRDYDTYRKYIDSLPAPRVSGKYKGIKIEIMKL
jgi:hypothetical protein